MKPLIAWSWSRLDTFEKCPLQFYHKNILKTVKFEQSPQMIRGERIHAHLENAVKGGAIHEEISHMAPLIERLRGIDWDDVLIEVEGAYNIDMRPVSWFGKDVWVRIKQDFMARKGDTAVALDWKTGRNYGYPDQLKLYAADAMLKWPEVTKVSTSYEYVDNKEREVRTFTRDDYEHIWQDFGDRAERIQIANETGEWPAKPSSSNCRFCPVTECKERK